MNAQLSPVEKYRQQVLPPEKATELWRSLPAHIKPAVFERNLTNALMQNPSLIEFHPSLIYREVCKAAGLGLLLDPQLGEAYIVVAWNGKTQRKEPQLRVGYKGMCKLARQVGDVAGLYAHEVCKRDAIECHLGADKKLIHVPDLFGDRGDIVGYYAVIKFTDGTFDFEPMTVKQCRDIRDRSDAWRAFKDDKIKSTPWATDEAEMSKKTVMRRLLKRQAQSPELTEAMRIEDEADHPEPMKVVRDAGPPGPQINAPQQSQLEYRGANGNGHADDVAKARAALGESENPAAEDEKLDPEVEWLRNLEGAFSSCEDMVSLGQKQVKVMAPDKAKVSKETWAKAAALFQQAAARIAKNELE